MLRRNFSRRAPVRRLPGLHRTRDPWKNCSLGDPEETISICEPFLPRAFIFQVPAVGFLEDGETMNQVATLFASIFTTLLAIINPLEALPVFLRLLQDRTARHIGRWRGGPAPTPLCCCSSS